MDWGEKFKLRLQGFTVLMAFMCPGFLIWMASTAKRQIDSYGWPEVPGVVEATTAKPWQDSKGVTKYFGRVTYRYSVGGRDYTSDLTDLGPGLKRADQWAALADVSAYRPGEKVSVYYDPADPGDAVIEKGIPEIHKILLAVLTLGSVVSIIASVFVIRSWLRPSRAVAPDADAEPLSCPPAPKENTPPDGSWGNV